MATRDLHPFCVIYSTFLQRAYDNVIHDVAIQHLPVVFAMDRAGLVGEDGPTHMGLYDIAYMLAVPGMTVAAPKNATEMLGLLRTASEHTTGPFSLRYPRDAAPDVVAPIAEIEAVPYGTWEILRKGSGARDTGGGIAILATGTMVLPSVAAAESLEKDGISATVVNCRFMKPYDAETLAAVVADNRHVLVVEEGTVVNGFGAYMASVIAQLDPAVNVIAHGVPDEFIEQAPRARQLASVGLDADGIAARVKKIRHSDSRGARLRAG
jgi:1-deoxy-D-xylulose-5-phosphate synthase